ncbi:ABC transporter substrate-binding protein [Brachybacterium vulturis]|uniref:ABC transporter substrate-binding protein n=1 Tax=Brachybacterium vulturis TaxID=2017484 RepID=UPI003735DD23
MTHSTGKRLHPRQVSRRGMIGGAAALGAGATLAACGGTRESGGDAAAPTGTTTGTLRVGHFGWVGNVAGEWLPEVASQFEEANDGVTVEIIPVASSESTRDALVQKLSLEARQGESSYDLLLGPTPWLETGALARAGAIHPLDDLLPSGFADNLVDAARAEVTADDGKMYSIPFWADVVGYIERPSLQEEHGISAPETWDDLIEATRSVELPTDMYHYGADWTEFHRAYLPILASFSDRDSIFAENGTVDMTTDAAVRALEVLKALIPSMPPNSQTPKASVETFYAGKEVSMTYWQSGVRGAINQGLPEDDVTYRHNLTGDTNGTFFWDTGAVVPKGAAMPEVAVKFMTDGFLGELGVTKSVEVANALPPLKNLREIVPELPAHLELAYSQLETAIGMPANDAFLGVMAPNFRTEVERMMADDLDPADVAQTLADAFAEYE